MKDGCGGQKPKQKKSIPLPVLNNPPDQKTGIKHSKTSRWRAFALILLNLLMIAHVIQWRISGTTISPIEPSEAMYTLQSGAVNAGFIFFALAILATLIFGRFVCGWGCHILALQDLCGWILKKLGLKPKPFRSRLLVFVPLIVALYMFVWPTVLRYFTVAPNQPVIPGFTNHIITTDFWATFPTVAVAIPFLFICGFVTVYFLGQKGFCTYGCPYGGFFSLADKVSPGKIRVTDACNQCGHCTATCTSNVLVHSEVKQYGMVVDQGCMKCMDCISVCPNDALYYGFGKPSLSVSKSAPKNYSLDWPEEIAAAAVFFGSFMAVWDVYQLVPMLMALGIAMVTTFLAFKTWRLFLNKNESFYRYALKTSGSIRLAGWIFAIVASVWIGLVAHSGWIHYNESQGALAFENLRVPDELALAERDPSQWLSLSDRNNIARGKHHLTSANRFGLFANSETLPKLAWFEYLSGNTEGAIDLLKSAATTQNDQGKALSLYYRGAILNRVGRYGEALVSLNSALETRPDLILAREEKGVSLWLSDKKKEAVTEWKGAVEKNRRLVLANNFIAGAADEGNNYAESSVYKKQADAFTPPDALFNWMLGLRLKNLGMNKLADTHFERAIRLNPQFKSKKR